MNFANATARAAIFATLALLVFTICASAQQSGPQRDPNMPLLTHAIDAPISWEYGDSTMPTVHFKNPPAEGLYLGFDEYGSLIRNQVNGKLYYWRLLDSKTMAGTLTIPGFTYQDIPRDKLESLRNANHIVTQRLAIPEPAGQVNRGPQQDPNMPPLNYMTDAPINWNYGSGTVPFVSFKLPAAESVYLGFNENGSLIVNQGIGKVYYWKLTDPNTITGTVTLAYNSYREIPLEILSSLRNPNNIVKERLAMFAPTGPVNESLLLDPNLPALTAMNEGPVYWRYAASTRPTVYFKDPVADADYLGFNEKGSMLQNKSNGKVFFWKLSNPNNAAGTVTLAFSNIHDIPAGELESLKNTAESVRYLLAQKGITPKSPAAPPPNPDKSGGAFGDNPQKALQDLAPATASPYEIAGKNASIKGGILTFTLADGAKSKPYTVARPDFMANAPQAPAGIAGTWVATESGGKGIMFTVGADNSVSGKEISPQVLQMLMQSGAKQ